MRKLVLITTLILLAIGVLGASGTIVGSATPGNGGSVYILKSISVNGTIPEKYRPIYVNGQEVTHYCILIVAYGSGSKLSGNVTIRWLKWIFGIPHWGSISIPKYEKNWREIYVYLY